MSNKIYSIIGSSIPRALLIAWPLCNYSPAFAQTGSGSIQAGLTPGFSPTLFCSNFAAGLLLILVLVLVCRNRTLKKIANQRTAELRDACDHAADFSGTEAGERTRALDAARESEDRLRVIFETSDSGIILVSPQGVIEFANVRMAEMFGMSHQELIGTLYANHLHASEKSAGDERMHQLIQNEVGSVTHERRFIRVDSTDFWGYLSGRRLENLDGSLRSLVGVITDISERKQAEEELSYSNSLTNATLESTADGILIVDRNGKISRWNQKFADLWQVPEKLLYTHVNDAPVLNHVVVQMAQPEVFLAKVMELYEHPEDSSVDQLNLADGRVFERYSQPQRIGDDIVGRFWSFRDVTERKQVEESLEENREKYRCLSEAAYEAIFISENGLCLEQNKRAEELFGYSTEEALGRCGTEWIVPEDRDLVMKNMMAGIELPYEVTGLRKNGSTFPALIRGRMMHFKGRSVRITSMSDITDRKEHEKELLKIEKLESLGVLAGGIAHDFNNILTSIMGNISFARQLLDPTHKSFIRLTEAEKASVRAGELAQQLLTFARGGEPVKKVASIQHLMNESVSFVLRGANVKGIVDIPDSLHAVEADEGQISQVFNNIIINATQAMPDGGTVTVTARNEELTVTNTLALPPGRYVRISCVDEGCGMSADTLKKIFDPYYTTKSAGNGLGLASAHSIISRHGGNISAVSAVGKGTTFTIYLPSIGETCAGHHADIATQAASIHQGGSILVMDDEDMIRNLATEMLEHLGYQVTTCVEGREAVALYTDALGAGTPFAVVIMDLTIPGGMGGNEAANRILALNPVACLIVSSGYSHDPIMSDYKEYGFSAAVAKPYTVQKFGDLLGSL